MKTYTNHYKKAIAAIGKTENMRETETFFLLRFRLATIDVTSGYGSGRPVKVTVNWMSIGAVPPEQAQEFVKTLAKVTRLAARIERDIKQRGGKFKM
jgi:hypothetical protein